MPALDSLLDLLYPPKCPFCGSLLEKGALLCPKCQSDLPWLMGPAGEKRVELTGGCVSALRYEGKVRQAIHDYKFGGKSARGRAFGVLISQAITDHEVTADLVSWPSLSARRLRKRGFDQAELLAREVAGALDLPLVRTLEKEDRPAQSGIDDESARRANLLGAYTAVNVEYFTGKTVLLIDDICTTGATLTECAKTLRLAGAAGVVCATLARAG